MGHNIHRIAPVGPDTHSHGVCGHNSNVFLRVVCAGVGNQGNIQEAHMTDAERRADVAESLAMWVRAQIANGHPAAIAYEAITDAAERVHRRTGRNFTGEGCQTTTERIQDAIREADA